MTSDRMEMYSQSSRMRPEGKLFARRSQAASAFAHSPLPNAADAVSASFRSSSSALSVDTEGDTEGEGGATIMGAALVDALAGGSMGIGAGTNDLGTADGAGVATTLGHVG